MMIANTLAKSAPAPFIPERLALGETPDVLAQIYKQTFNLAIWKRPDKPALAEAAQQLLDTAGSVQCRSILPADRVDAYLDTELPQFQHRQTLIDDISLISDMFACLFGLDNIGFRFASLDAAMCPKFHVDRVPCRLLTSYCGVGTEWLADEHVDRSKLGTGSQGLSDAESGLYPSSGLIQRFSPGDVGLLKGELWEGNENRGLVHRSPVPEKKQQRLLLTLDFA
ncbi:DUF1826 domain-containing protein [Pseudoteredinibacter isoporae]|uniref:DUF1826 domain-containing protein n=1 Tax=Pseudoteredinibacter isoporae TaxID=570281 RepID=A0A7X0JUV7_9GAMM|nr:DUF1826 domain-containing protein [Pseudoteredinibacter isoporae]MBB6522239.1 hypothetical protein [Pseudoteredinibacter isoporae]NHO87773.1 DUF1826 domain-containing protein [Pseudoteredinibacter isoporae]NIB23896.1 DUF1826 domain-containing protein [Pseudoteredinibacter isoporae]